MAKLYQTPWIINEIPFLVNKGDWPAYIIRYSRSNGYTVGGGSTLTNTVERFTFSTDTTNSISRTQIITPREYLSNLYTARYGWFAGGSIGPSTTTNMIDRVDLSNDTAIGLDRADIFSVQTY